MTLEEWQAGVTGVERVGDGYRYASGGVTYHGTVAALRTVLRSLDERVWAPALGPGRTTNGET